MHDATSAASARHCAVGAAGLLVALMLAGCGAAASQGSSTTSSGQGESAASASPSPAPSPTSIASISRAQLEVLLDAGFGRFLRGVETEPHLDKGRFVGFRLRKLYPNDPRFARAAIRPGDTIMRVNGQPIERPEQALRVWQSLRVASELWIEFLRDGRHAELRLPIVDP